MPAELMALTAELHATTEMLRVVVDRLDAADKRANRHRAWTSVLALCVLAIAVLGAAYYRDDHNDDIAACLRANATRADIREAILETVRTVAADEDPDELEAALVDIDKSLRRTLPDRNC